MRVNGACASERGKRMGKTQRELAPVGRRQAQRIVDQSHSAVPVKSAV